MPAYRGFDTAAAIRPPESPAPPHPALESAPAGRLCRRILVLLDLTARGEAVLRHATGVAATPGAALMAVCVLDRVPWFESDGPCGHFLPEERLFFTARAIAKNLDLLLARNGASWAQSEVLYGKTDSALALLVGRWKPDLVVADASAIRKRAVARGLAAADAPTRLLTLERGGGKWNVVAHSGDPGPRDREDRISRAGPPANSITPGRMWRGNWRRTALLGVATVLLYGLLFANEGRLLELSAKGRWNSAIPLVVAFVFSFVHGAFTSEFWHALGVRARQGR